MACVLCYIFIYKICTMILLYKTCELYFLRISANHKEPVILHCSVVKPLELSYYKPLVTHLKRGPIYHLQFVICNERRSQSKQSKCKQLKHKDISSNISKKSKGLKLFKLLKSLFWDLIFWNYNSKLWLNNIYGTWFLYLKK